MKLYAETPKLLTRQAVSDLGVLVWCVAWAIAGRGLYRAVEALRASGDAVERAGGGFADTLGDVAGRVGQVPIAGSRLQEPFRDAAGAGTALAEAGRSGSEAVHDVALWSGWLVALLPIVLLAALYLRHRYLWVREATAAARIRIDADDLQLFALRAVTNRPLHELVKASPDPAAALAAGDYRALAQIELRALGLRV